MNDRQAVDRVHRLGQTRPVTVHRLVCASSVDAKIAEIAERKSSFADAAMGEQAEGNSKGQAKISQATAMKGMINSILAQEGLLV
eukprot:SAG11_NODE_1882_length_4128_cov_2.284438_2_plen_85_part_00